MRRRLIPLLLVAGCWDNPLVPEPPDRPTEPLPPAEAVLGTWQLDPVELAALPTPERPDEVGAWLAAHPDHPEAARARDAANALRSTRVVLSPATLTVQGPGREHVRGWTLLREVDARTLHVETRDERDRVERLEVRLAGDDRLELEPLRPDPPVLRLVRAR